MDDEKSKKTLQDEITALRERLYEASRKVNSLSHPDLVNISQILDRLLNQIQKYPNK